MWTGVHRSLYRQSCRHMRYVDVCTQKLVQAVLLSHGSSAFCLFSGEWWYSPSVKKKCSWNHPGLHPIKASFKSSTWSDTSPWLANMWQHVPPTACGHRTQLLEETLHADCEARLWTQCHVACVCAAALYLRVQTPHLGYRKFTLLPPLSQKPWSSVRGVLSGDHGSGCSDQISVLVCVSSALHLPPLAPQPALTKGPLKPLVHSVTSVTRKKGYFLVSLYISKTQLIIPLINLSLIRERGHVGNDLRRAGCVEQRESVESEPGSAHPCTVWWMHVFLANSSFWASSSAFPSLYFLSCRLKWMI